MKKLLLFSEENEYENTGDDKRDYRNGSAGRRIIKARRSRMFSRGLNRRLMISHRIEAVVVLDLIMIQLSAVYHAPIGCRKANNLRGFGVFYRSLDIDFQSVEAKINISYPGVYHRD